MPSNFSLSHHAHHQMQVRNIDPAWIEATLTHPDRIQPNADSQGNTHYRKQIANFGDRWLRVIVNPTVDPQNVITLFFDRRLKS
ncbi:DUF4258 domain-containing protein [Prochlorothrix hollandica]|nr:DUF4258 domain-containing protein [Prochlorothrix hollandica]